MAPGGTTLNDRLTQPEGRSPRIPKRLKSYGLRTPPSITHLSRCIARASTAARRSGHGGAETYALNRQTISPTAASESQPPASPQPLPASPESQPLASPQPLPALPELQPPASPQPPPALPELQPTASPPPLEESRRRQLIEVTIDSLAELGYVGTTLAQIAGRAGRVRRAGGALLRRQGRFAGGCVPLFGAARGRPCPRPPAANQHPARSHPGRDRCQLVAGGICAANRHRVAGVLGPGAAEPGVETDPIRVPAPHAHQSAQFAEEARSAGRSAKPGGHDRRDDRWGVAARGAVRMARGGQRTARGRC